jgi:cell wall-associated NlpC family hydrolase
MRTVDAATEAVERANVCRIAREYQGTPYHANARRKGLHGGVDCLTFIVNVYEEAGLIAKQNLPHYSATWHLHSYEEKYKATISSYCRLIDFPQHGDLVLYKMGKCFSHGVIVLKWPTEVIHAYFGRNVFITNADNDGALVGRTKEFYSFWSHQEDLNL